MKIDRDGMLNPEAAYTMKQIGELIDKTESFVSDKFKEKGIKPEGQVYTSSMGRASKCWRGSTVRKLVDDNVFDFRKIGDVEWFDLKPTKVYIITFKLNVDGKSFPSYKIGYTKTEDVLANRFKQEIKTGLFTDVDVYYVKTFNSENEAILAEKYMFEAILNEFGGYQLKDGTMRFHNFYTKEQPKGITEMREYNADELERAKELLSDA